MELVRFGAYRQYEQTRTEASNAVMGLLAGAQMAAHMLQLTDGSERLLPEIFPRVAHIRRFNLKSAAAQDILTAAETHLGAMAVPYALAIHEDYLKTCLTLLVRAGMNLTQSPDKLKLANQHEAIEQVTGKSFTPSSLQQVHTLRHMRNCTIHSGGRVSDRLLHCLDAWRTDTEPGWVRLTGRSPRGLQRDDIVEFGHGEVLIALAATKTLAREANRFLQHTLPRSLWADLVVEDLLEQNPLALRGPDALRRARGYARHHYKPLALTEAEIAAALARAAPG